MNSFSKILSVFLLLAGLTINLATGQTLPVLNLKTSIKPEAQIKCPISLSQDDICVTVVLGGGMTAHDYYTHYIFRQNGNVLAIREELPKTYLKNKKLRSKRDTINLDESEKLKWIRILSSKMNLEFVDYSQKDFYKPKSSSKFPVPCVSDAPGYSLSYIQNNMQQTFSFYAPEYYSSNKCKDVDLNKPVLDKFVALLKLWEVLD